MTQQAPEVIFHAFLIILERQCVGQISAGEWGLPSDLIKDSSKIYLQLIKYLNVILLF